VTTSRPVPSENGPLGEVLAGYLQTVERGENPDRQALLAGHPELADELAAYFADLDRMNRVAGPLKMSDQTVGFAEEAAAPLPVIRYFGDYVLEAEIARGGMGVVYRARQKSLNRVVALKMILAGQLASAADVQRFKSEAEAAANLDHPNILPIYEVGEHEGRQYFTMKLVEGGSLAARPAALLPEAGSAADLAATLARAVHFAHQRGILHRDLKPANVLIDAAGTPYITDFGLAKKAGTDSGLTQTGVAVGTPSYMAPEQARGEKGLTVAVDVYSLGAILYELLTGRPPFRGETVYETIRQLQEQDPPDPRLVNKKADRDLAAIALKCLAKNPSARYASAADLADDLDRWRGGEPTRARPPSLTGLALRWLRRNARAAAVVVLIGVAWGFLSGLGGSVPGQQRRFQLLAEGQGWLNPIIWVYRLWSVPAARWGMLGGAMFLWLSVGWWLRAGVRPKTASAAMGAAAVAGLLGAWVCNLWYGPIAAAELPVQLYPLKTDGMITWRYNPDWSNWRLTLPDIDTPHPDLDYLAKFVPLEKRDPTKASSARAYSDAQRDLLSVNRYYAATFAVWVAQFFTLLFFLSACLISTWAVDYLFRSGRRLSARLACYFELYLPTMAALVAAVVLVAIFIDFSYHRPDKVYEFVAVFAGIMAVTVAAAVLGFLGVVRRWHPAIRLSGYVLGIGLVVLMLRATATM
jgi:tRNA A-37 threonylcarbamoyl transferase component Bud32